MGYVLMGNDAEYWPEDGQDLEDLMSDHLPCPNLDCVHEWDFMDRRDLDECPVCGWAIPDDYRMNRDFEPIPPTMTS